MSELILKSFTELTTTELYGILQLRSQVFVVEQDCVFLDLDGVDTLPGTRHAFFPGSGAAMADSHGAPLGQSLMPRAYARILPVGFPDGPASQPGACSIGRVVTDQRERGQGWGRTLIGELVAVHADLPLTLNAQSHLEGFYAGFGFAATGPRFTEDGIEHTPMSRPAASAV